MVGQSKILTVSYGTFSCTLEGFDEPFSTMRGIAEYFRDLAADDRYFGAEPPTPDADMLHRIAEREIRARVETRIEDGAVVLRQTKADDDALEMSNQPEVPSASDVEEDMTPAAAAAPAPASAPRRPKTLSVAEKLAQLRAAAPEGEDLNNASNMADAMHDIDAGPRIEDAFDDVEEEAAPIAATLEMPVEDFSAETNLEADAEAEDTLDADPDIDEATPDLLTAEPLILDEDEMVDISDLDLSDIQDSEPTRIDASDDDQTVDLSDMSFEEDDLQNQPVLDDQIDLDSILADDGEPAETENAVADRDTMILEHPVETDAATSDDVDFAAIIAAESEAAKIEEAEAVEAAAEHQETVARIVKMRKSDFQAFAAEERENARDREATIVIDPVSEDAFLEDVIDQDPEAEAVEAGADILTDDTPEATTADAEASEIEDVAQETAQSNLSDDDEADLMQNLSRLEHDVDDDDAVDFDYDDDEDEADDDDDADFSSVPISSPTVGATSVERLFDVTNSEMAGRESSRRRSAIAHLKAAVAATRADREESDGEANKMAESDSDFDISAYREDLARVVRPKRPGDMPKSEPRRLPPLMLVSEQRIDDTIDEAVRDITQADVRPRRIEASEDEADVRNEPEENIFDEASSFAEFASEMGAHELPDLLEAAAAYYSYVEGQEHFSRPQIMKAVAAIDDAGGFNREDGLRSFGQLLRNGKIHKIRRGQFEIDKSTRFRPLQIQAGA